jgi:hypothetical protein
VTCRWCSPVAGKLAAACDNGEAAMSDTFRCPWCDRPFRPRRNGGKPQRFCCAGHRLRYWGNGRKWLAQATEAGFLSLDDLRCDPAEFFGRGGGACIREGLCQPHAETPPQSNVHVPGAPFESEGARGIGSVEEFTFASADTGPPDPALLAALRRRGMMLLRLPISPEGIADLVTLDWLDRRNCGYLGSVANAVSDLADAALEARLRPRWS